MMQPSFKAKGWLGLILGQRVEKSHILPRRRPGRREVYVADGHAGPPDRRPR
jgi:hypothetical protein